MRLRIGAFGYNEEIIWLEGVTMGKDKKACFNQTVLIRADAIGKGDSELGKVLVLKYLNALVRRTEKPQTLIFMNSGVHLLHQGTSTAVAVERLQECGVQILADLTAVEYYRLNLQDVVGEIVSNDVIVEILCKATNVLTL